MRVTEYLEAVRDIERRIQRAEEQSDRELPEVDQPAGIPATYEEHAKLMFDLMLLAYQTDLTRVSYLHDGARDQRPDVSRRSAVPDSHHPTSHHRDDPTLYEKIAKINEFHISLFGYFLEKARATPDGDGNLLDHMMLLYGGRHVGQQPARQQGAAAGPRGRRLGSAQAGRASPRLPRRGRRRPTCT